MITIAIPFYNAEQFLKQAIDSVFNQTYKKWKLLLVDDGSTDSSLEIANYYLHDARVSVHSDGKNLNLGYRLNQIPTLVQTKYLARMDADDIMHPQKIQKQLEVLERFTDIDVLGTNAYSIDENSLIQGIRLNFSPSDSLKKVVSFIHPTIVAKTTWFLNNPYDVKAERIEDAELWFRTANRYNFQILAEPLFFYREFGKDYHKKYFKGFYPMFYVLNKYSYSFKLLKFAVLYYLAGSVYFLFNLLGKESVLIRKRNAIIISNKPINSVL